MNKIQLFPHQQKALESTKDFNRVAYYLDMGLGKTFVGSEKMCDLGASCNLLICQKSKIQDWIDHYKEHYNAFIYDLTNKKDFENFFLHADLFAPRVGIINYDLVFRRSELLILEDFTLMLDESSQIQNETAKRSKFILKMQPKNVILLSGTPTAGKYENLWSQVHLLGWNINKNLYWKHYIETEWVEEDGFFRKEVVGYKNVDRLKMKLAQHGAIFMKSEEVVDLPEQIENKIMVPTTKEYRKFMKSRIITIDGKEMIGDTALTKRLYARMLCGHYNKYKLEAFKDLIDSTDDRLIVFYNFNDEVDTLRKMLDGIRPISYVNGTGQHLNCYEKYDNSITFVQYQAGAMGLNLQKANKAIYFTLPQSSELFEQSKKRIHRIGQNNRCFYYYMICKNSVEEDILSTLEMRKDYTDALFEAYEKKVK